MPQFQNSSGVNATLMVIRQQYWILLGRQHIRLEMWHLQENCWQTICNTRPSATCEMLSQYSPNTFEVTGVDFTGVLYVHSSEGETKVYVCLFTSALSRAVYLEVVVDLIVVNFLHAFCRFVSRRSLPRLMLSDDASTCLAMAEELHSLLSSEVVENVSCVEW